MNWLPAGGSTKSRSARVAREDRALRPEIQVAAQVERVQVVGLDVVLDVVVDQAGAVRRRPDLGDLPRDGIDTSGRNDVAFESLTGRGIVNRVGDALRLPVRISAVGTVKKVRP